MPVKRKARKTRKSAAAQPAARRTLSKKLKPAPEITPEEVVSYEVAAARQQRSEQAWLKMTSVAVDGEEDRWVAVEEHLLAKPHESEHSQRRWKHFSK
jgi:hypothetical protein